jgi:RND family efflux transporter MFP subunit
MSLFHPTMQTRSIYLALAAGAMALAAATLPALARAAELATALAEVRDVPVVFSVDGAVEAIRQATVGARVAGRVLEVRVDAGRTVKQGDVIARIDEREAAEAVASSTARIAEAEAALSNARVNYERAQKLVADKFVSAAALDKARSDYDAARAAVESLRASARQVETARGYSTITAPMAGVVVERHMQAGDLAQPGKPIATIFDPRGLRVIVSVPQQRVATVQQFGVAAITLAGRESPLPARSIEVLPTADARTHASDVRVVIPEGVTGVYPGMSARVEFTVGRAQRLVIPPAAVVRRSEVTGVYVVSSQGAIQFRQVRLGVASGAAGVEVLAGIQPGERVAIEPQKALAAMRAGKGARASGTQMADRTGKKETP